MKKQGRKTTLAPRKSPADEAMFDVAVAFPPLPGSKGYTAGATDVGSVQQAGRKRVSSWFRRS